MPDAARADIMVVDDQPSNLLLLQEVLSRQGHRVRSFTNGRSAFAAAQSAPPDLILLDVNMPELDGYESCRLFKQDPALAPIPVIFLSALSQTEGKVAAFRAGGVDYITKPFELAEIYARVATHLQLHHLQNQLRHQNLHLDAMVQARTAELALAHRQLSRLNRAKSDFLRMISHELRTPLNGLLGAAELILDISAGAPEAGELAALLTESQQRLLSLMDSALLLTQIEMEGGDFQPEAVHLGEILAQAEERVGRIAGLGMRIEMPADPGFTTGNRELLVRAFEALLRTASRFCAAGDVVAIGVERQPKSVRIAIDTPSGAVPERFRASFFDLFGVNESSTPAGDLGLEPAIASRIFGLFGSSLAVENLAPAGIRIGVECPADGYAAAALQQAGAD